MNRESSSSSSSSSIPVPKSLEVLFTPADFSALSRRDLSQTVCVVFDILRATTSMITALANGAKAIRPVAEISEALELRRKEPTFLLAGERDGLRIEASLTGGIGFDLGNSPREFTPQIVRDRVIAMTTTNGTRALRSCIRAKRVFVGAFLNLSATARAVRQTGATELLVICSGTFEEAAYEDILAAGALCDLLWTDFSTVADSALAARALYQLAANDLLGGLSQARNGRRLLSRPDLREDVAFCAQRDIFNLVAELGPDGVVASSSFIIATEDSNRSPR